MTKLGEETAEGGGSCVRAHMGRENNRADFWVVSLAQHEWAVGGGIWVANKFVGS